MRINKKPQIKNRFFIFLMWHMVDFRPGYLTIVDLWDIWYQGERDDLIKIREFTVAEVKLTLYYRKYPANLYLSIGDNYYRIRAAEWETKDKPVRFVVNLFDRGGRQLIRFVIFMDKGYKKLVIRG